MVAPLKKRLSGEICLVHPRVERDCDQAKQCRGCPIRPSSMIAKHQSAVTQIR